jgi:hypothetical protein
MNVDVLLLPEMAFTGYVFESRPELEPYAEQVEVPGINNGINNYSEESFECKSPTLEWAQRTGTLIDFMMVQFSHGHSVS